MQELAIKEKNEKYYKFLAILERKTDFMNRNEEYMKKLNDIITAKEEEVARGRKELNLLDSEILRKNRRLAEEQRKSAALQEQVRTQIWRITCS